MSNLCILGIDPGSRLTGYGLIRTNGASHQYVASGCIKMNSKNISERLQQIYSGLTTILQKYQPHEVAIEQVFVNKNVLSALKLGHARGAAMVAIANNFLPIAEYTARRIKQSIVGNGAAEKTQVQHMIKVLLNLSGTMTMDASDALAVAICHAHSRLSSRAATRGISMNGSSALDGGPSFHSG